MASRVLVVLLVEGDEVDTAVQLIQGVARTDHQHDGRILITTIDQSFPVDPTEPTRARRFTPPAEGVAEES